MDDSIDSIIKYLVAKNNARLHFVLQLNLVHNTKCVINFSYLKIKSIVLFYLTSTVNLYLVVLNDYS